MNYLPYGWHNHRVKIPDDLRLFQKIQQYKDLDPGEHSTTRLLPSLRRLEFADPIHASFSAQYLLGKHTVALSLDFLDEFNDLEIQSLFPLIKSLSPNMENLVFGPSAGMPLHECPHLAELVVNLQELRGLKTGTRSLTAPAIRHLAALPYLHTLTSPDSAAQVLHAVAPAATHPFKSLHQLELSGASLECWPPLLARLRPHLLESIILNFEKLPSRRETHDFFSALSATSARNALRTLHLCHPWKTRYPKISLNRGIFDFEILENILAFDNLTSLHIELLCGFAFDDSQITQMVKSWPKLQSLQLGSYLGWGKPSAVTHRGLLAIVAGCPDLETLGISFDASEVPHRLPVVVPETGNTKVKFLHVGDSRVKNPTRVANFISRLFPKLDCIGGHWQYIGIPHSTDLDQHQQLKWWQEVSTTLQELKQNVLV